jgi:hypothetical protein
VLGEKPPPNPEGKKGHKWGKRKLALIAEPTRGPILWNSFDPKALFFGFWRPGI